MSHFDACVVGEYHVDETAPTCTVDSLDVYDLIEQVTYITETGYFEIMGTAEDNETAIENIEYNRTSPDFFHVFSGADTVDGSFNDLFEDWRSDKDDKAYVEGEHTICCRAADEAGNVAVGECKDICIDTQDPVVEGGYARSGVDCSDDAEYWSQDYPWVINVSYDVGCAGIDYYVVQVYKDGGLFDEFNQTSDIVSIANLADGAYYLVVSAVDKAGNHGEGFEFGHVIVDKTNPEVTITSPTQGTWFNNDFVVTETDTDTNLLSCEYKIANNGNVVLDWTSLDCGSNVSVDISEVCAVDGTCRIYKSAKDKACNENDASKYYYVDTTAPTTTKEVGNPKYSGAKGWMGWVLDWFITDTTDLTFTCDDGKGIGCEITYFTIYNATGAVVREGNSSSWSFDVTMDLPDGVYNVTYYSVDSLGNEEELQWEIDKVDTIAPETTKTYDIFEGSEFFGMREVQGVPISNMHFLKYAGFDIVLSAVDSEVGVKETWWSLFVPENQQYSSTVHPEAYLGGEWYNEWDQEYQDCVYDGTESVCSGVPDNNACDVYDHDQCLLFDGCLWDSGIHDEFCIGEPTSCDSFGDDQATCLDMGCEYCEIDGCYGVPDSCDSQTSYGPQVCEWAGCTWDVIDLPPMCYGTPIMPCEVIQDIGESQQYLDKCSETPGCEWIDVPSEGPKPNWEEECNITFWENADWYLDGVNDQQWMCQEWSQNELGHWCKYNESEKIQIYEECDHKICYYSEDLLGNEEEIECQVFSVDDQGPAIAIHNPTIFEVYNIQRCDQSVVVEIWDDKSGVDESSVYAELWTSCEEEIPPIGPPVGLAGLVGGYSIGECVPEKVREISLNKAIYNGADGGELYEGIMDKQLSAGMYELRVYANDNVGNGGNTSILEYLQEGIYVEYVDSDCILDVGTGGTCDFEFNVCMRGNSSVQMWMDKLGENPGLITPNNLSATIYKGEGSSYVGLAHIFEDIPPYIYPLPFPIYFLPGCGVDKISDAEVLILSGEEINGKTTFSLSLDISPGITELIGTGVYDLEYYIDNDNEDEICFAP